MHPSCEYPPADVAAAAMGLPPLLASANNCIIRDTDTPDERRRKRFVFPLICVTVTLDLLIVASSPNPPSHQADSIGGTCATLVCLVFAIYVAVTRSMSQGALGLVVFLTCIAAVISDWSAAARLALFRPWNWIILGMDLCLAFDVPRAVQRAILPIAGVYLAVVTMGATLPLGIFDTMFTSEAKEDMREHFNCGDPPCAQPVSTGVSATLSLLAVLFGDYIATRSFADGLRRREQATTQRSG
eukprot:TRINITY_DN4874_c0_g2_i1.p1 TRINITY_DN4874_c0_g2~~TRINITY_DN4874_c0_g2_i1.p1  ORF type:complete len:243 (+),score=55.03 TRINITY_DN4874_c0_g2_i1:55-783(+)